MTHPVLVKICGLSTPETLAAALDAGADFIGLVFFAQSPRHLSLATARDLASRVERRARIVALCVDPTDTDLDAIVAATRPDLLQLHGHETPERTAAVWARSGVPVMKALGISTASDLVRAGSYADTCERLLYDAKPPRDASVPGGNGLAFDWSLLSGHRPAWPWMLSGGLTPENVGPAIAATGATAVDVSSGVESAPGIKDPARIRAFIAAVREGATSRLGSPAGAV